MARLFDDGTLDYLEVDSAAFATPPFTMAGWFYTDSDSTGGVILAVQDKDTNDHRYFIRTRGDVAGDPIGLFVNADAVFINVDSTAGYSINTWHHAVGVGAAADDWACYLDGGSKGTSNTSCSPVGMDRTSLGADRDSTPNAVPFSGSLAETAIWNVALTDAEIAILALGYSPLFIRPQNLVFYVPLIRDNDKDIVGGLSLTAGGTPAISVHPRIIYPGPAFMSFQPVAVGGGSIVPLFLNQRRRRA